MQGRNKRQECEGRSKRGAKSRKKGNEEGRREVKTALGKKIQRQEGTKDRRQKNGLGIKDGR